MSRVSDLRTAICIELSTALGESYTVEEFVTPAVYSRESLTSGPRVVIRSRARSIQLAQGFEPTDVLMEVGVIGVSPNHAASEEGVTFIEAEVAQVDEFDALLESIIALWKRDGAMNQGIAEHAPVQITQPVFIDEQLLREKGLYYLAVQILYRDSID